MKTASYYVIASLGLTFGACVEESSELRDGLVAIAKDVVKELADGVINVHNPWGDMGVQDQPNYTGIDTNSPRDRGIIASEQMAVDAMDGEGCLFGAHGDNPDDNNGETGIQSFPEDTSPTICHPEYHPECVGATWVLSVCFAGNEGDAEGYEATMHAFMEQCGVNPEDIIACTGPVIPGVPMGCEGTLVDGNGNPIGNQTVGGLDINEVGPEAPGERRCGSGTEEPPVTFRLAGKRRPQVNPQIATPAK